MSHTIIDDQDLSRVTYEGNWIRGGSPQEHDATVASSTRVNDYFTVRFTGNSIVVYGTIDATSGGVLTNYSIDGLAPAQVTSQAGAGDTFNQQFWRSPFLTLGEHKLIVTMIKVNPDPVPGEGTIWFDYFLASDPLIKATPPKKALNIAAIAGSVAGGLIAVALLVLGILFLRHRRNKRRSVHVQPLTWPKEGLDSNPPSPIIVRHISAGHPSVEPYILGLIEGDHAVASNESVPHPSPFQSSPRKTAVSEHIPRHHRSSSTIPHRPNLSISSSSSTALSGATSSQVARPVSADRKHRNRDIPASINTASQSPSSSIPAEPAIQHVDSGVRANNLNTIQIPPAPLELPPIYSPV
ncbi:hypothetical protein B0H34DRAFT_737897 [Crassisporium funariophilum]|nr:hypothetical protein B0H34DRAFT_737897 [Crassisporium funariophilum]